MKKITILLLIFTSLIYSCKNKTNEKKILGKVKKETVSVVPKIPGKIIKIYVSEGDIVKKGDTLALLDLPEVATKVEQAEGALFSASAQYDMTLNGATTNQIKQLQSKLLGTKEQYDFAEKSVNRIKNLLTDSLISKQKYDETYAKYMGAKAQYDAASAELAEALKGVREESQRMALGQKDRAKGAVNEANVALKERYILAPDDMSIETITLHQGELALAGYAMFNGYLTNTASFRFTIAESEISKYSLNLPLSVEIPYLKKSTACTVTSVKQLNKYAEMTTAFPDFEISESVYEVKLTPSNIEDAKNIYANATAILLK
ncbi:MAG: biotin/lipoyl-binding protein [Bacteroidota bacterium]